MSKSTIVAALVCIGLGCHSITAHAAVGRTSGSFNVSNTGAANYSIPIWTPPGTGGMQPGLALSYSSNSGDGLAGPGWGLSGLSQIGRCNGTYLQDGTPSSVTLSLADKFCIDGKRLRLVTGTYGAAGSTYQTEVADFSKVTANSSVGNGPGSFTVQGKNGLIYEYGNSADSRITPGASVTTPYVWLLNKVSDRSGNNYVITYGTGATGSVGIGVPQAISYSATSFGATTYDYTVTFNYGTKASQSPGTNDPAIVGYVNGTQVVNTNLLLTVDVSRGSTLVHRYSLGYGVAPTTTRARLTSVTECAGSAGTDCFLPTSISYQDGVAGVTTSAISVASGFKFDVHARDFNGDGHEDIAYSETGAVKVAMSSGASFAAATTVATTSGTVYTAYGDLSGLGKSDLLISQSGIWWYYRWNGSSFVGASTGLPLTTNILRAALIDVDGDGRPELVTTTRTYNASTHIYFLTVTVRHNNSSGSTVAFGAETTAYSTNWICSSGDPACKADISTGAEVDSAVRQLDFNGDRRADIAFTGIDLVDATEITREVRYLVSNGSSFSFLGSAFGSQDFLPPALTFANWNDDGCTDTILDSTVLIASCTGDVAAEIFLPATIVSTIDWNHDGRSDALVQNGSNFGVVLSTGTGNTTIIPTSIPNNGLPVIFDQNGDGLADLAVYAGSGIPFYANNSAGAPSDLVTSITDGFGVNTSPTYVSIAQNNYTKYADAVFPDIDYVGSFYVVNQYTASDGIGGNYSKQFWYYGARLNLQGRGFDGFDKKRTIDSRNGLVNNQYFRRDFPFIGAVYQDDLLQADGTTAIRQVTNSYLSTTLDSTVNNQRYFPFVSNSTQSTREFGLYKNGLAVSTTSTAFTYDNYGNATNVATTIADNDSAFPASPYAGLQWTATRALTITPDANNWCLGLPTVVTTTNSAPGVPSITRTVNLTPDFAKCRPTQKVTEPSSPTYAVTEGYGYDNFGNVNSVNVTGVGMPTRTTGIDWGTSGQFPITVTNPLGHMTTTGYDLNLGVSTSASDPNGISVSWQYDNFGRKTRETRADNTYSLWSFNDCSVYSSCVIGAHAFAIVRTDYKTDGTVLTDSISYLDSFDRPVATASGNMAGGYDRSEVRYNSSGQVDRRYSPCAWVGVTTSCSYWTTYTYDALNRETQESRPINATNSTLQSTTIAYQGLTSVVTDAQGKNSTKIRTVAGTLVRSQDHDGYYQIFTYDAFGNVLFVTDSLSNTLSANTYAYGVGVFQTGKTDIDMGSWGYTPNALGEVVAYTDANGAGFSMLYDPLSRPTSRTVAGEGATTWVWGNSAANYNIGRLQSVSTATGPTESYTYDSKGRLTNRHIASDAAYDYDYAYQATTGLPDTLTYPTSTPSYRLKLQYNYQHGVLNQVKDFNSSTVFWAANSVNPRGQVTQETLGNGLVTNLSFDAATGWINNIQCGITGGTCAQNQSYLFDLVGNLIQRQNNNLGLTENFFYDNVYRLQHSELNNVTNLSLTYDPTGNITSRSDVNGGASWTYDATHKHQAKQAGSAMSYTYDFNGNAVTRNGNGITWSKYNYPTLINGTNESAQLFYDANQARWKQIYTKAGVSETTIYVGGQLQKITASGATDYRHLILANGQTIAIMSRLSSGTNATRYLLRDFQGSVVKVTDSAGAAVVSESFTAFGDRRSPQTWSGIPTNGDLILSASITRDGFTGQDALGSLGLNHMNGRVQDAITGRFLSADPHITNPGFTQNYNRYSYVANNPMTYVDPTGWDLSTVYVNGTNDHNDSVADFNDRFRGGSVNFSPSFSGDTDVGMSDLLRQVLVDHVPTFNVDSSLNSLTPIVVAASKTILAGLITNIPGFVTNPWDDRPEKSLFSVDPDGPLKLLGTVAEIARDNVDARIPEKTPGWLRGILIHFEFAAIIKTTLQPAFNAEVSYQFGANTRYGLLGSVRADAIYGPRENPIFGYELKTGNAVMTTKEADNYVLHMPGVPIFVISVK